MGSFKDRVVLIESVGDDIAYAIARKVASKGAKLALLDIDGKKISNIVARLKEDGI
jgi:3-oxoacyl-[acyl-carrier protein] reductase/2-[hydroxy(phenyl)methyl]-succinyl-CoA dehydrogenase BbsC subunit